MLLCPGHHWLVHEGKLHVEVCSGKLEFVNTHGLRIEATPRHAIGGEAIAAWLDENVDGCDDPMPTWDGSRLDLHEVIGWMMLGEGFRSEAQRAG